MTMVIFFICGCFYYFRVLISLTPTGIYQSPEKKSYFPHVLFCEFSQSTFIFSFITSERVRFDGAFTDKIIYRFPGVYGHVFVI